MKKITTVLSVFAFFLVLAPAVASANQGYGYAPYQYQYQYVSPTPVTTPTTYTYSGTREELIVYLNQLIAQLQSQLQNGYGTTYYYYGDRDRDYNYNYNRDTRVIGNPRSSGSSDDEPDVDTYNPTNVEDTSARLRGEVDMNDFNNGEVFFVYGEDENQIEDVEDDFDSYNDVDEDGDDLQKVRVDSDLDGDDSYEERVYNLDRNTDIYYQICVGYEDEDDDDVIKCGGVEDFETDDNGSNGDDEPDASTYDADDIEDDRAKLYGEVDMNDFDNGIVFFVYGEDENQIEDVEDDYDTYSEVDEDGDDLQKVRVDSDLDGDREYWETVTNLDSNTDIFFQICVQYEDEDNDDVITCGGVEQFETD